MRTIAGRTCCPIRLGLEHDAAARRDAASRDGLKAVLNEGIGGNTVTREGLSPPPDSTPGLERLERDVLSHHGVTDVVLFMGTNDIRRGATAASVIEGTSTIIKQVKAKGHQDHRRHDHPPPQRRADRHQHRLES